MPPARAYPWMERTVLLATMLALTSPHPLAEADPASWAPARFAYDHTVHSPCVDVSGDRQETAFPGLAGFVATGPSTLRFVDALGQVHLEPIAPGGGFARAGDGILVLHNPNAVAKVSDPDDLFVDGTAAASANLPCPDGTPSTGHGTGSTATPKPSDCWSFTQVVDLDGNVVGISWTCDKPDASDLCEMTVTEPGGQGSTSNYEGECTSTGGNFKITVFNQGRIFACQ